MATNGNGDNQPPLEGGDLLVLDLRTMEELCQPTLNGRGGPIASLAIQATNFGLKNDMIQQVQNSFQFHRLPGDDANKLDKFLHITQSIKVNGVTDDALRLYPFPHSLTHHATAWFDHTVGHTQNVYAAGAYNQGGMNECLALADLGASINLMPLSIWKMLSLPDLSPTCMTLKLADRSISRPVRVVEDVSVKVGKFHFPVDFVVVDFDADPQVPLFLRRSFLKNGHALIDVYERELTLRVGNKAVTFNLDQTSRYSSNYDDISVNRIDVIDVACEEYSQEVLRYSMSSNPTPSTELIVSIPSPTLTLFGDSDFLLEETDAFLAIEDEPISPEIDDSYYDSKGDILLLEEFLIDDPSSLPLPL
nr:reverse transcriptase domain-containing protein [Tanacetum cinerariifolium]